jgi:hypothetical protein
VSTAPTNTLRLRLPSSALDGLHHAPASAEARAAGGAVLPGRYQHGAIARLLQEALGAELEELECAYLAPAYVDHELSLDARVRPEPAAGLFHIRLKLLDVGGGLLLSGNARLRAGKERTR